jgi:hypothetical protein
MNTPPPPPGAEPADESAVRIGALVPLTRPGWVSAGRHLLAGLELAVGEVNDAGGIAGMPLALVVRDTAADPDKGAAAVGALARLGVAALAGEYHSVVARAAAAAAEAAACRSSARQRCWTSSPTGQPTGSRDWRPRSPTAGGSTRTSCSALVTAGSP